MNRKSPGGATEFDEKLGDGRPYRALKILKTLGPGAAAPGFIWASLRDLATRHRGVRANDGSTV